MESEDMQKPDSKSKNKNRFKRKYRDIFLVFAVLMITGVLLAISASAQFDQQPPGASGQGDFATTDNMGGVGTNQQPMLTDLESDKPSPQEAGSSIKWTAKAEDTENDPMSFMFRLKGPSMGDIWEPVRSWSEGKSWKWDTSAGDAGNYQISVLVRDEMHAGPDFAPNEKIVDFKLTAPPAPAEARAQPTAELPIVTAQEQTYVPPVEEQPTQTQPMAQPQETKPANLAPVMTGLTSAPASPQEAGTAVTWVAEASDQESDGLQYLFLLDDQPATEWQNLNQWTWAASVNEIGAHSIEARVRDGAHNPEGDSSKTASFTINKPNEKPVISELAADKASPQETGCIVTWTALASDAENNPILYRFFLNGLPTTDWQPNKQWVWTAAEGEAQVEVQVRDGKHAEQDGFDDKKSATFVINAPNQKPTIINFSPDKLSPQETGSTITWTVEFMDAEGDPLQFLFSLDGQVMQDWSESPVWIWTATKEQVGQHAVEAKVRDGKHNAEGDSSKSANFEIVLPPNDAPAMSSLAADKESPQVTGTAVTWTAAASDVQNDPLQYQFFLDGQVMQDWSESPVWIWTATKEQVGQHAIEAKVKDGKHSAEGDSSKSANFEIVLPPNDAPVISSLTADRESPQTLGTTVTWTAKAEDAQSDPISYRFLVNGTPATEWQSENQWTWTAMLPGSSQILVQVKDGLHEGPQGEGGNMSREFSIIAPAPAPVQEPAKIEVVPAEVVPIKLNESPALAALTADKESPQILGTAVTFTAQAGDPESDPISYRFLVNGTPATDWQSENLWIWTAPEPGSSQILVQVKDGLHDGPQGEGGNMSREFSIIAPAPEIKPVQEPIPETVAPPVVENITTPVAPENVTPQQPVNETEAVIIAPETVVPPAAENLTTPIAPENVTPQQPANETKPAEPAIPPAENRTPVLNSLTADVTSPQIPGTAVTWTADATDADSDPLLFRFFLSGTATSGAWQPVTGWSDAKTWTEKTSATDVGENQIKVQVRDGKHAAEDGFDSEVVAFFTISEPAMNISGAAYDDKNGNGLLDSGEALSGWSIQLVKPDNSQVSTITKDDGSYRFEKLKPGSYTISEALPLPSGWIKTIPQEDAYSVELKDVDATDKNFANKLSSYSISGMKYNDLNGNGANDGEPGMEGWTIQLSKEGSTVNSTTTGKDGSYKFVDLMPGSYSVKEIELSGWARTAPQEGSYSVMLVDADATGKDFGNHGSWSISGANFNDLNGNGAKDGDETALAGWNIQLAQNGNIINATTTGQDGSYAFKNLAPGKYTVSEVAQEGWTQTLPQGSYSVDLLDADISGKDFGNKGNLSITGKKFYDANGNGVQDEDEPGLPGQEVKLVENGKEIATVTTGQDGTYTFSNLVPGTYEVDDPIQVIVTTQVHLVVNVPAVSPNIISGMKFNDLNGNGAKDTGEPGVPNWGIDLVYVVPGPAPDILLAQVNTDANGAYKFINIPPGSYEIKELARQGWTATTPAVRAVHIPGSSSNQNFGNKLATQPSLGSIFGMKFNDLNGNGAKDGGEAGLPGWTIQLKNATSLAVISTTDTGPDGSYAFLNITPGNYVVSEAALAGWTQTKPPAGPGGQVYSFALAAGENKQGIDFGNRNNNLPPINPTLVSNLASPRMVGTPVIWTAGATDPEGDVLQFRFFVRGPAPSSAVRADTGYSTNNVWTWSTVGYAPGTYQIEVWIRDGNHAGSAGFDIKKAASFAITSANLPPIVNVLFSDRPAPQFVGSWIKWTALATDPEGDPLQYKFYLRGPSTNGFWMDQTGWGNNNRWIWRTNPMDVGYSQVLVAVRDGHHAGPAGSDDYEIAPFAIINQNLPPVITSLASNVNSPQPIGATVMWRASSMDPEGNPVFYRYWLKGPTTGGLWRLARDWSTDPTWVWPTSPADAGTSEIQVQVRDGLHSSPAGWDDDAGALFTVLRPNQPPTLISLKPDRPSAQIAGTPIKWMATASDPDREPVFYKFWLKGPSTAGAWKIVQDWSTKSQWTWTNSGSDGGAYTVFVYVRDGKHNPATGYDSALGAAYQLTPNQPPRLTALVPDKRSPQSAGTTVKWTATATDANREPMLYRFWLKGPSTANAWKVVADWSTNNQWIWTNSGSDGGDYTVFVYVRDGKHNPATGYDSALGALYQLTANEPPKLTTLAPDRPSPQSAGTSIKWTATATDANRDPMLYQFWLRGPSTAGAWKVMQDWSTMNQWTWTNAPTDAGSYRVYVYARDGKHAPATAYDSAVGQDYVLKNLVVSTRVAVIGRPR
ncbi:MAG: SpaA isopeptide-forming pilin-related protein [Methanothrix sp.]|nr:SpaA isopeptide-forming pilin-related protein [Methanothrix sp.]